METDQPVAALGRDPQPLHAPKSLAMQIKGSEEGCAQVRPGACFRIGIAAEIEALQCRAGEDVVIGRGEALHGLAVAAALEHDAQRLVARHDGTYRGFQPVEVDGPFEAGRHADVVARQVGRQRLVEPDGLLGELRA